MRGQMGGMNNTTSRNRMGVSSPILEEPNADKIPESPTPSKKNLDSVSKSLSDNKGSKCMCEDGEKFITIIFLMFYKKFN